MEVFVLALRGSSEAPELFRRDHLLGNARLPRATRPRLCQLVVSVPTSAHHVATAPIDVGVLVAVRADFPSHVLGKLLPVGTVGVYRRYLSYGSSPAVFAKRFVSATVFLLSSALELGASAGISFPHNSWYLRVGELLRGRQAHACPAH